MTLINELDDLIHEGLMMDIFLMERAYYLNESIGKNSERLNSRKNGNFGELFSTFQGALSTEAVLAASRCFDRASNRHPTRCIDQTILLLEENSAFFSKVQQVPNVEKLLKRLEIDELLPFIEGEEGEFVIALAEYYRSLLDSEEVKVSIDALKTLRNKRYAHNESAQPEGPTWNSLLSLIEHAKNFVAIVSWAFRC